MKKPKVTVLMPVFNAERFLKKAIDSILFQSFREFEFLIIDDGSTDKSAAIVESYGDRRIRFHRNPENMGITATLNRGIELASAPLIARMDADDISYPRRLQRQYDYMVRHPYCALLSAWARVITEDEKFVRLERYPTAFYYYNLTFECWIYHPTVMFRKGAVAAMNLYQKPYSEDYDLFWRLSTTFEIGNLEEALVDYRLSSTSLNTVLRRDEYEIANEENVKRNIRFYLGDVDIPKPTLECLRHNFGPIVSNNDTREIMSTLLLLEQITEKILEKECVNRDAAAIRRAYYFKRRFILKELSQALPGLQGANLLLRCGAWLVLYQRFVHALGWRLKRVVQSIL